MWPVEGSTKGLLWFKQFSLPKAYEAHEVSGSVDVLIASTLYQYGNSVIDEYLKVVLM